MVGRYSLVAAVMMLLLPFQLHAEYTNVVQILNLDTTPLVLSQIDGSCHLSPDRLFLAYIKHSSNGDLEGFLSLFEDEYAQNEFGMNSLSGLTDSDRADFQSFVLGAGVTNRTVVAYSCSCTNEVAEIYSQTKYVKLGRETLKEESLTAVCTNGVWRFVRWSE